MDSFQIWGGGGVGGEGLAREKGFCFEGVDTPMHTSLNVYRSLQFSHEFTGQKKTAKKVTKN